MIKIELIKNYKVHPSIPWLPKGKILTIKEFHFGDAKVQFQCIVGRVPKDYYKIVD